MPKEYKSGNISVISYEDKSIEIWNKDSVVILKNEEFDDYLNCMQMLAGDNIRKLYGKGYGI